MNSYFRILQFARPYRDKIVLAVLFNILMVLFSLGSVTIIIPVLKIIFENTREVTTPLPYQGIGHIKVWLESQLNYTITIWAEAIGEKGVLLRFLGLTSLLFVLKNLFRYLGAAFLTLIKNGIEKDLRNAIHNKMLHLPIGFFTEQRKGDIIARLTTDIVEIQWALLSSIQRMVHDPLMILSTIILLVILSPKLTFFVVLLIPVTGFIITFIGNSLKKPSQKAKEELGTILSLVEEHLTGLPIIKSYVAEREVQEKFAQSNHRHFRSMNAMLFRRELASPTSETLGSFVILAIVWFGSLLILENQELQPEVFITYIALFYQIINPAKSISLAIYDIKRGEASSQRILELLDMPNQMADKPNAIAKVEFNEHIDFKDVTFRYNQQNVLENFSLHIPKAKTIALVGQSGSGKTTLANLLNRFYDVTKGSITIDGIDIRNLKIKSYRNLIGYISQHAILFNDSIKNNLLFAKPDATEEEIIRAAQIANADDFILATEQGYDTNIGDGGQKLSGGQRQRLTIARAVLKNPPILILDEATSALDSESEQLVQTALEQVMKNRTSIVIAHRLSTIQYADEIIVMKEGKIIERGTHEDLLQQKGAYKKLVELQAF